MPISTAQVLLDTNRTIAPISPLLFGGFAEHMGRCIYEGIYDPESPHADERGLRKDVIGALRDQAYTVIRRTDGRRNISVTADVASEDANANEIAHDSVAYYFDFFGSFFFFFSLDTRHSPSPPCSSTPRRLC